MVVQFSAAFVAHALAGAISRRGRGAPTRAARDVADLHVEDSHRSAITLETHPQPGRRTGRFKVPRKIGKLLELGRQHRGLRNLLLTDAERAARAPRGETQLAIARTGGLAAQYLALADEARCEL